MRLCVLLAKRVCDYTMRVSATRAPADAELIPRDAEPMSAWIPDRSEAWTF